MNEGIKGRSSVFVERVGIAAYDKAERDPCHVQTRQTKLTAIVSSTESLSVAETYEYGHFLGFSTVRRGRSNIQLSPSCLDLLQPFLVLVSALDSVLPLQYT